MKLKFEISHPGEHEDGIAPFSDTVTLHVESGDPGGERGEFASYALSCIAGWYSGAKIIMSEVRDGQ